MTVEVAAGLHVETAPGARRPLSVDDFKTPATGAASEATAALIAARLLAAIAGTTVSGTVAVSNLPATQPVSGPLTDAQMRAAAVPVSGPATDAQMRASALAVSGPLTDAQVRATALPVSGPLTDAQARATPLEVTNHRYSGAKLGAGGTVAVAGNTTIVTPAAGKKLRVVWVSFIPDADDTDSNLVTVSFTGGQVLYVGYAVAHWEVFEGATNEALRINTQNVSRVAWTVHYQEI